MEDKLSAPVERPEMFYKAILERISDMIGALSQETHESQLIGKQDAAKEILQNIERDLHGSIDELRQNADWKTFTLAFYGETNAGKSTLIETLRILLNESTKTRLREEFRTLQLQLGASESNLGEIEARIETLSNRLTELAIESFNATQQHEHQTTRVGEQAANLQRRIETSKHAAGWIHRILNLFRKLPEELELQLLHANLAELPKQHDDAVARINREQAKVQRSLAAASAHHEAASNNLHQLKKFEDGGIIGDGRSDFTRNVEIYTFDIAGTIFQILDVPGIEGDEAEVSEQIGKAVQRAHAVFYVTAKAAAPQTGDPGRPGTLEKIKTHLGAQTEVWTLFNKRITNPKALQKSELLNAEELASIEELNKIMRGQLGHHYQGTLTLSALPAFLAVADCLTPRSANARSRENFLSALGFEDLLDKSLVKNFCLHLGDDLIKNYRAKIISSNLNKIRVIIQNVCTEIERLSEEEFCPLAADLSTRANNAGKQMRSATRGLKARLEARGEQAIGVFESNVRNRIYDRIASNIGKDQFTNDLKAIMKFEQQKLQADLPELLDKEIGLFQKQVGSIVERFEKHADDLMVSYRSLRKASPTADFTLSVTIDNGIKVAGLLAVFAGGAAMIWNPGGWVLITIGIATLAVGLVKSVWGFFDDDYKKGQQRKATEENLKKVCEHIRESFRKGLDETLPTIEQKAREIRELLKIPVRQTQQITDKLDSVHQQLKQLSSSLHEPGTY